VSSENHSASHSDDEHSASGDHSAHHEPEVGASHGDAHAGSVKGGAKKARPSLGSLSKGAKLAIASTALSLSAAGVAAFFLLKSPSHSEHEGEPHADAHGEAHAEKAHHGEEHHADAHGEAHAEKAHHAEEKHADAHGDAHGDAHAEKAHHGEEHHADAHGEAHAEKAHHGEEHHADAHGDAHGDAHAEIHAQEEGVLGKVRHWYDSVRLKAEGLRRAEEENERLRVENANLRFKVESLRFDCHVRNAETQTRTFEKQLVDETGSKAGRVLASLNYRPPSHLNPGQLYTLAVSYFKGREDEKAAVILTMLTEMRDSAVYKVPKNFLMTGIAWYRLDNYDLADLYFNRVVESAETESNLPYQGQSRLWRALVAHRLNKPVRAQFWLRELVDHHPRSLEASWVNRLAGGQLQRALASPEESQKLLDRVEKLKKDAPTGEGHGHH
jgi:hypothetical protein